MTRPKNEKTHVKKSDVIYDSMQQAAAAMHFPKWILSKAKARGCGAFRAGRVHAGELRSWLQKHGDELSQASALSPVQQAILRRILLQIERLELDLSKERSEFLPRVEVNRAIDTANALVMRELYRAIESELPPRLEGLDAPAIKKTLKKKISEVLASLPKHFENAHA